MKRFEMIYFALPILILFGIRTTLIERMIPGTDVISSHLSFYLYTYEILISFISIVWLFQDKNKNKIWFAISVIILTILVYISSSPWMTFLHVLRIINLSAVFLWVAKTLSEKNVKKLMKGFLMAGGGIAVIAIIQFYTQSSIGISIFHEADIAVDKLGVAKYEVFDQVFIRPYSILPHPNVLGWLGVTLFSMVIAMKERKYGMYMFIFSQVGYISIDHMHWSYPVVQYTSVVMGAMIAARNKVRKHIRWNQSALIVIATILVLLSFSRLAWGTYIALTLVYVIVNYKMFHVEHFSLKKHIIIIVCAPFLFFGTVWRFLQLQQETSVGLRRLYLERSIVVIRENVLTGTGVGNYVQALAGEYSGLIPEWQFEPVHNVLILVFAEIGIVGGVIILIWMYVYKKSFK